MARTSDTVKTMEDLLLKMPQVADTFAVIGFSFLDGVSEPNAGFMVVQAEALRGPDGGGRIPCRP